MGFKLNEYFFIQSTVMLSWKVGTPKRSEQEKRHVPISFETSPSKGARNDRQIYAPPRDKYSRGAGTFSK